MEPEREGLMVPFGQKYLSNVLKWVSMKGEVVTPIDFRAPGL